MMSFRGYTLVLGAGKAKVQHVLFCMVKWALGTFLKTGNRDQNKSGTVLATGCFLDLTLAVNTGNSNYSLNRGLDMKCWYLIPLIRRVGY